MREFLFQAVALAGERCGFRGAYVIGATVGRLLWLLLPRRRRLAMETVHERLGLDRPQARAIARESFMHTGRAFFEACLTRRVDWRFIATRLQVATPQRFTALQQEQEPVVVACAHFGSWELLSGILQLTMPQQAKGIVVREGRDQALNQLMRRQRGRPGVEIIGHRGAAARVLRLLRRQGVCAFLVDHNTRRDEAVFVSFLGKVAAVNAGPALLAVRAKAAIWPAFLLRNSCGRYVLHVGEPLRTQELQGSSEEKIKAAASFYTHAVEDFVRQYPEQWFWMHKRWKTRPEQEPSS